MNRTLGDVQDPSLRETLLQWEHLGRRPYIVAPDWNPKPIQGLADVQQLIDAHLVPRLWQLLADFPQLLQKFPIRVQKPGWLDPAVTAEPLDLCTEDETSLTENVETVLISYQVPDRHVASLRWFGHMLSDFDAWGEVVWTIRVNKKPVRTYFKFKQQRGNFMNPTRLAAPIKLKGKDRLEIVATGGATSADALARIQGWLVAATSVTQDGTAKDWNVR